MKYLYLLLVFSFISISCLETSEPDQPGRIDLTFEVPDIGSEYVTGTDTLIVNEFKFSMDRFTITDVDSVVIGSDERIDAFIVFFNDELDTENLVISTSIGFPDLDRFVGYDIFVQPVRSSDNIADSEFFGDPNNFSLVINGSVNGESFMYRSNPEFVQQFSYPEARLTFRNETLLLEMTLEALNVLVDEDGSIIDPRDEENSDTIDERFRQNITVSASAIDRIDT